MTEASSSGSKFCMLIVLGKACLNLCEIGEGGKVLCGILGEGRECVVNFGLNSKDAGVVTAARIAKASWDEVMEAVLATFEDEEDEATFWDRCSYDEVQEVENSGVTRFLERYGLRLLWALYSWEMEGDRRGLS